MYTAIQDSPTFPLYTDVMSVKQPIEGSEISKPPPPHMKQKVDDDDVKDLSLVESGEQAPDVPAQNLTEEDIRDMNIISTVI